MHSTIFQIAPQRVKRDDFLSSFDIADYDYGNFGIDYVGDEREDEDGFETFEGILPELFILNRGKRTVTVNRDNIKAVLHKMVSIIREKANILNEDNILNWRETYDLKNYIEDLTGGNNLFYYENELMGLNQLIKDIACDEKVTTLYIGAMLDYHI